MRVMERLCELATALEDIGLIREADEVDEVMQRVAQTPPGQAQITSLRQQLQSLLAQQNAITTQKANIKKPTVPVAQNIEGNTGGSGSKEGAIDNQAIELDKKYNLLQTQIGMLNQQIASLQSQMEAKPVPAGPPAPMAQPQQ